VAPGKSRKTTPSTKSDNSIIERAEQRKEGIQRKAAHEKRKEGSLDFEGKKEGKGAWSGRKKQAKGRTKGNAENVHLRGLEVERADVKKAKKERGALSGAT